MFEIYLLLLLIIEFPNESLCEKSLELPENIQKVSIIIYNSFVMSNKVEVKRLITGCQGLSEAEKRSLRGLLDKCVVEIDSMMVNGALANISDLKLVISDNQGKFRAFDKLFPCSSLFISLSLILLSDVVFY